MTNLNCHLIYNIWKIIRIKLSALITFILLGICSKIKIKIHIFLFCNKYNKLLILNFRNKVNWDLRSRFSCQESFLKDLSMLNFILNVYFRSFKKIKFRLSLIFLHPKFEDNTIQTIFFDSYYIFRAHALNSDFHTVVSSNRINTRARQF